MHNRGPIWFGVALVVIVAAIGVWIYFISPPQGLNVGIQLSTTPANTAIGDPFDLSAALTNDSGQAMENAAVSIVLPSGLVSVDSPNQRVVTQTLGSVGAGSVSHQDFHIVATNGQNALAHVTAKVTYTVTGSSAQFESDQSIDIPVGQPAVNVSITAPQSVFSGQNFPTTLTYNNNTDHAISGLSVSMQYPPAFSFSSASSSLSANGNGSWGLGMLAPGQSGVLTINGNLVGPNGGSYPMAATVVESIGGQNYTIQNPTTNVSLAQSPIGLALTVNNSNSYVSTTGDSLDYVLSFTNNSTVTFQNVVISAKLTGGMFDFTSVSTNGSFDSVADTISWNGAAVPQLLSLAPGQSGSVNLYVRTKSAFPIRLASNKNYTVEVSARLQSSTVPPGTAASSTVSVADLTTKLGGNIVLNGLAYHGEPTAGVGGSMGASGIKNTGPYPPVVNKASQYTIHWLITNYATDANNVTISAYLQSGTSCTGADKVPASTTFSCDSTSGAVSWQIPVVPATTGITGKPLEAVFQVKNTPAINQLGQDVTLVGPVSLAATDAFTSSTMQASIAPVTTALPNDTSVNPNARQVTQ